MYAISLWFCQTNRLFSSSQATLYPHDPLGVPLISSCFSLYGIWCLALLLLSVFIYSHTVHTGYSKARISFNIFHDQIKSVNKDVLFKESHDTLPVCRHSNPPDDTRKCGHVTLSVRRHCHYRYYLKHLQLHFPEEQVRWCPTSQRFGQ